MGGGFLPPWVVQVFGLLVIAVFVVLKIETGQESALLVGVGVTLVTTGVVQSGYAKLKRELYKGNPPEEQDRVDE